MMDNIRLRKSKLAFSLTRSHAFDSVRTPQWERYFSRR